MVTVSQTTASDPDSQPTGWQLTASGRQYLLQTAKWSKLLAITGFILMAYWVVNAFTYNTFLESFLVRQSLYKVYHPGEVGYYSPIELIYRIANSLFIAFLYFLPSWYLYRFSSSLKQVLVNGENTSLHQVFLKLKSFFKTGGIIALVLVSYFGLLFIFFILNHLNLI